MIVTTTDQIDRKQITKYCGIVTGADTYTIGGLFGEGVLAVDGYFSMTCEKARKKMEKKAQELNADAVVGVKMSTSIGGTGTGGQVYVSFVGTAVNISDEDSEEELPEL